MAENRDGSSSRWSGFRQPDVCGDNTPGSPSPQSPMCRLIVKRCRPNSSRNGPLRLIAIFKLLKAALLIAIGLGALKLVHKDMGDVIERWVEMLRLDPNNRYIDAVLEKASSLTPGKIKELGLGSLLYAALFSAEGIGLWLLKVWAEWLTVIITSSLVPLEVYEIWRRPTWVREVVLAINIAIVGYLLYKIRDKHSDGGAERGNLHGMGCQPGRQ
jgi:uncharacterized membrane protein (DUF2068 family)